jgi:sialidase-1
LSADSIDLETPSTKEGVLTVCFWIRITDPRPTQVIANHGHRSWEEPGWSVYIHQGNLVASLHIGKILTAKAVSVSEDGLWHHATANFDFDRGRTNVYLDGNTVEAQTSNAPLIPPGPPKEQENVVIGGYTDTAGGHFNYTFGRRADDRLDDLCFYDRVLTTKEINGLFNPTKKPLVADFTIQLASKTAPTIIHLDASSSDPVGRSIAYWWDLGDGGKAEGKWVQHTYQYAGQYPIRLTVVNDSHAQADCEQTIELGGKPQPVKFTSVFINGEEGYAGFRIPSIVAATNGDLVAFAEGRLESISDSTRTIRIVCKRSQDNGRSWGPLQVVSRYIKDGEEYAAMYPAPVVDVLRGTGRIVLVYKQMDCSEWELVQGLGSSRMACIFSDDHGATWHSERDITNEVHCPGDWRIQIPTAGHAIQLRGTADSDPQNGRLFHIGSHTVGDNSVFNQHNYAFWSDDLGKSWQVGPEIVRRVDGTSAKGINEAMAVELSDGRILINSRNYQDDKPVGCRAVTKGEFDREGMLHFRPTRHDETLIEPAVQASILRHWRADKLRTSHQSVIIFANPAHRSARRNLTIRASYDNGETWPVSKVIDSGPSSYSDLVEQADGEIGILYERGNDGGIYFGSFSLEWLTDTDDPSTIRGKEHAEIGKNSQ